MSTETLKQRTSPGGTHVRTVTTTEVRRQLGTVLQAVRDGDSVVIEQRGEPRATVISMDEFAEYQDLRRREQKREALAHLKALQKRVSARNTDLTEEQAMELATRFVREVVEEMYDEGKIRYADEE